MDSEMLAFWSVFNFFLFGSAASFALASAGRITEGYREGRDDADLLHRLSAPSRCGSCGTRLSPSDLVPVFSCLALRGRCRHCGVFFGFRPLAVEFVFGVAGILTAWFLFPLWEIFDPWRMTGASVSFASLCGFLFISAFTDLKTGYVWDFSGLWCALSAGCLLLIAGEGTHLVVFCVSGWAVFLTAMTGKAGYGDAAPLSAALSASLCSFSAHPFSPESISIYSLFIFSMSVSGILHAVLLRCRDRRVIRRKAFVKDGSSAEGAPGSAGGFRIPLVPHIVTAFVITTGASIATGGTPPF